MTYAQAARMIALLEQQTTSRVDVVKKARSASSVLAVLAALSLVGGAFLVLVGLVAMAQVGFTYGLVLLVSGAAYAVTSWGLLTTASVVAGYVANRS